VVIYCNTSCRIRGLIYAYQAMAQFEHVVSQGYDDELGILRAVLDVVRYNGDISKV